METTLLFTHTRAQTVYGKYRSQTGVIPVDVVRRFRISMVLHRVGVSFDEV